MRKYLLTLCVAILSLAVGCATTQPEPAARLKLKGHWFENK